MLTLPRKNLLAGLFCILLGAFIAWRGRSYGIGTLEAPDPGFFPVALGTILFLCGVGLSIGALKQPDVGVELNLRPYLLIPAALVLFAVTIDRFGLIPSVALVTIVATLSLRGHSLRAVLFLTCCMIALVYVVFVLMLSMPLKPFMWRP
ncbi:tripartite tricarboxylate transporter TctB family protein [Propylenella binzhouense]|uniref:tripartite tricarboxylate transporter TctB family protein n=1 Tax=Propylenella binzhouense TaxID=2555902 RepID=UPI00136D963F|nr:tripartite tricarboxylate transporter TctB family protein [Propylenella binzhouense]